MAISAPGVYIEEISTLPPSIAPVATAIPAFIGYTEIQPGLEPVRITSLLEYEQAFGFAFPEVVNITIQDFYTGQNAQPAKFSSRTIQTTAISPGNYKMYYSMKAYFDNGGGPCWIVSVGLYNAAVTAAGLQGGIAKIEKIDEPTLLVFPDQIAPGTTTSSQEFAPVYDSALNQCNKLQDRFVIMDVKTVTDDSFDDADVFRSHGVGINFLKYGAAYYPFLRTSYNYRINETTANQIAYSATYIGDGTPSGTFGNSNLNNSNLAALINPAQTLVYDPSLYKSIYAEINKTFVEIPPSGAMAGIYARVDRERGVWKAPANVGVLAVIEPTEKINNDQQEILNVDGSGKSINAIRTFAGKGTIVWGARTLAGNDNEWRYVPVRRLFIYVEESVKKATEFVVFEPNDANTWIRTKTMIENFLLLLWRDGALAGAKPEQAFFVKIGLGTTMTSQDILEGRMNVEIGLAAVRPAEFIVLKFSHLLQTS